MDILLKEVRIRNYRSIKSIDLNLEKFCLLIGQNNVGKTSLLSAINLAFAGSRFANSEDIFVSEGEKLPKNREAIIDLLIIPVNENNERIDSFSDEWFEHFGDFRSEEAGSLDQFVALRTKIKYSQTKGEYVVERKALLQWPDSDKVEDYSDYKKGSIRESLLSSIPVFYMDAQRDIVSEMKERGSYFGKMVSDVDLSDLEIEEIEKILNDINETIIDKSGVLKHLSGTLEKISGAVKSSDDSIKINPVSRKIRDLNRGIDISFQDYKSESFPISRHGMGTRSWITFLTLTAFISWKLQAMEQERQPYHPIVLIEEPEAHLHPQAQRHLLHQINQIVGQKIVSSHSSIIAGQVELNEIRQIKKSEGVSEVSYIKLSNLEPEEVRKINREVINTRGDLLFANAMILCEGETEEQAIPTFFYEKFGIHTYEAGVNVVGVGGKGNYKPFLQIAKDLNIKYFIFSDGENDTIKKVEKDIKKVFGIEDVSKMNNIVFLDDEDDFEAFLIKDGYADDLVAVISELEDENYLNEFIRKLDNKDGKSYKTPEICDKCKQNIYTNEKRDYSGHQGYKRALLDCISSIKTKYSSIIAQTILDNNPENKIPSKILDLLNEIALEMNISTEVKNEN